MSRFTKNVGAYKGSDARNLPSGATLIRTCDALALRLSVMWPNSSSMTLGKLMAPNGSLCYGDLVVPAGRERWYAEK